VSPTATRAQLCGIALVLAGGFYDLQRFTRGYGYDHPVSLGAIVVTTGVLLAVAGFVLPTLNGVAAD
jgi:hypothetical protein